MDASIIIEDKKNAKKESFRCFLAWKKSKVAILEDAEKCSEAEKLKPNFDLFCIETMDENEVSRLVNCLQKGE